jgi:hypothetical protein
MGALLVLLVVLAERAGQRVVAQVDPSVADSSMVAPVSFQPAPDQATSRLAEEAAEQTAELVQQLESVEAYQAQLDQLRAQGEQRLEREKQRLVHLEKQTRKTEHELARLALAVEQLKATENNQSVDQQQAEHELERLEQLIVETEKQLADLQQQSHGKRSYAIVPYRGPNGTHRKPIYIECQKEAVVLHPSGIRLTASDFLVASWPGNPLAAMLRATRDHENSQALQRGESELPDPYPLILVRPEGIATYVKVRQAIASWDTSFGYEFIDSDWNLEFQEGPDPLLVGEQQHALMLARERMTQLIRSAPSRFQVGGGVGGAGSYARGQGARGAGLGGDGPGSGTSASGRPGASGSPAGQSSSGAGTTNSLIGIHDPVGPGSAAGAPGASGGAGAPGEAGPYGALDLDPRSAGESSATASVGEASRGSGANGEGDSAVGSMVGSAEGGASGTAAGTMAGGNSGGGGGGSSGRSAGGGGSSSQAAGQSGSSIAESHGQNWAISQKSAGALPIRRPIQLVVRENHVALLPSRHTEDYDVAQGLVIVLDQSMAQVADQLVSALRSRVADWGIAGRGLYWRPVLELHAGPNAGETVQQVVRLLKDSGVEVSLPETAQRTGGEFNATR